MTTNKSCFGISSITHDNKHIVVIDSDIDHCEIGKFFSMCKMMQHDFKLSTMYIIKSEHGFNAFTLDKIELEFLTNMLYNYDIIDELFIYFNDNRGYYTLRWGSDKELCMIICSQYNIHEKSNAHRLLFNHVLDIPIKKDIYFDNLSLFEIIAYENEKHGWANLW